MNGGGKGSVHGHGQQVRVRMLSKTQTYRSVRAVYVVGAGWLNWAGEA